MEVTPFAAYRLPLSPSEPLHTEVEVSTKGIRDYSAIFHKCAACLTHHEAVSLRRFPLNLTGLMIVGGKCLSRENVAILVDIVGCIGINNLQPQVSD
jgi:hypothetical protein